MVIVSNYLLREYTELCWLEFLWVPTIRSCNRQTPAKRVPASLSLPTGPQGEKKLHPFPYLSKFLAPPSSPLPHCCFFCLARKQRTLSLDLSSVTNLGQVRIYNLIPQMVAVDLLAVSLPLWPSVFSLQMERITMSRS